ncbi:FAD-dependent oxidoreductase [Streptomyces regalis]|uniref:FAD/NAD(P)-binding domain-containing protein n=1 Tax=Streptomyces regalis TaxID=68262 RepID=A0A0X3VDK4_9ACTN|nr:FAD-dependent oxidoreductase [Streptomyces regalis]KUL42768.1 hypothetical protein ADL12_08960 [Streptomyces regalis]
MSGEQPVVMLVHSDPWKRLELSRELETWYGGGLEIVAASDGEDARAALKRVKDSRQRLAIVVSADKLTDGDGSTFLGEVHDSFPDAELALLSAKGKAAKDGISFVPEALVPFLKSIEELFFDWHPALPEVEVTGDATTERAYQLRRFLLLNGVLYRWDDQKVADITVKVSGKTLVNPTLSRLSRELKLIPEARHRLDHPYDLVVVGGGPAGMSAAVNAAAIGLTVLVIENEAPGGEAVTSINVIENYLGFPEGILGSRLAQSALHQTNRLMVDWQPTLTAGQLLIDEEMEGPGHDGQRVKLNRYKIKVLEDKEYKGAVSAGMVLLAGGQRPNVQGGENEGSFRNRGVYYTVLPNDAPREKGKNVVIVGGGDSAGQAALLLDKHGAHVTMVIRKKLRDRMAGALADQICFTKSIAVLENSKVIKYVGAQGDEKRLAQVDIADTGKKVLRATVNATSVYVLIGGSPNTEWLDRIGFTQKKIDKDKGGYIKTDVYLDAKKLERNPLSFETSLPGVFAAGDTRIGSLRRVGQAVGQGAAAVASMDSYLKKNAVKVLADQASPAWWHYRNMAYLWLGPTAEH